MTSDISRSYRWSATYFWESDISRDIAKVCFFVLYGYWRTSWFLYFGEILLAESMGFVLIFGDIYFGWEVFFFP
jgi:hypothetical protein